MTKKATWLPLVGLSVIGMVTLMASADDGQEEEVTLDQVPAAVQAAILKESAGAEIAEIEREKEHGVVVYEARWVENGTQHEAEFTAEGALLEIEETIRVEEVPPAVRTAIAKHFGSDTKVVVEKTMIVVYEVEAKINGQEKELLIFPTGRVHEESDDDPEDND